MLQRLKSLIKSRRFSVKATIHVLSSILIPTMIAVFTVITTIQQQQISDKQRHQEQLQVDDAQKEATFVSYIESVASLILEDVPRINAAPYIRAKTLTTLRKLDAQRKAEIFLFLQNSKLHYCHHSANFNNIQLNCDGLFKYDFTDIHLENVYMANTSFSHCNFLNSFFNNSCMTNAELSYTTFESARIYRSKFDSANLSYSVLFRSQWLGSSLTFVDFTGADIERVDFTNANLTGAILTDQQLQSVASLDQTLLPNRTFIRVNTNNLVINGDAREGLKLWEPMGSSMAANESIFTGNNQSALLQRVFFDNYTQLIDENRANFRTSAHFINEHVYIDYYFLDGSNLLHRFRMNTSSHTGMIPVRSKRVLINIVFPDTEMGQVTDIRFSIHLRDENK